MRNDELRLQTVDRALTLLSYLNANERPHQLRELAAALMMDKAVMHRLLRTMIAHAYVVQDAGTAAYRLGPRARALGRHGDQADIFGIAREPMRELAAETGCSTFLTLPLVRDTVCVDRVEANAMVRVSYDIGRRLPYHAGAPGKALLAAFAPARRQRALGDKLLERHTARSITSRSELDRELARIGRRGFATSVGEIEENISGVAAVIYEASGEPAAALSISGVSVILRETMFADLGARLMRAAGAISRDLGAPIRTATDERELPC
jgi:IclR family transcriptional regulator, acetate operon repressor